MKFIKACLFVLLGGFLTLLLIVGIIAFLLTRPSPIAEPAPIPVSPQIAPKLVKQLEEKVIYFLHQIEEANKAGEIREVSLEITNAEVNAFIITQALPKIQEEMAKKEVPFKIEDIRISFTGEGAYIAIKTEFAGFKPHLTILADLQLAEGKPQIFIKKMDLGRLPLPGVVEKRLEEAIRGIKLPDLPIDIKTLDIQKGRIILEGLTKGKSQ